MKNMSHQWASLSLDHLLPPSSFSASPALPTSLCLIVRGIREGLALAFQLMSLHPLFSFPVHMLSHRQAEVH